MKVSDIHVDPVKLAGVPDRFFATMDHLRGLVAEMHNVSSHIFGSEHEEAVNNAVETLDDAFQGLDDLLSGKTIAEEIESERRLKFIEEGCARIFGHTPFPNVFPR